MATKPDNTDDEKNVLFGSMTDQQRADMTDEELAGIDGDEEEEADEAEGESSEAEGEEAEGDEGENADEDEGEEAGEDAGEGEDGEAGEGDGEGDGEGEGEEAGADTGAETAGNEAGEGEGGEDEDDPLDFTRSVMPSEWQLPKDAQDKLKGLNDQAADLAEKFDSGDLTAREYHSQREALDEQRGTLRSQIGDAQKAWNKGLNDWANKTVKSFMREHKEYSAETNPTMNRMLDAEVRALQLTTNDPFNPRILRQAHANILKATGKAPAAPAADKPGKAAADKNGKAKPPVVPGKKKPAVPPTLARVPQDQIEDANGGKYARLDRLSSRNPHEFEETMLRMSAKDRAAYEEYLAGGV